MGWFFGSFVLAVVAVSCPVAAQSGAAAQTAPAGQTVINPEDKHEDPCVKPAPLFSAGDYSGPFNKAVTYFSRKLDIKTVHPLRHRPGKQLCSLSTLGKLDLFRQNTLEPVTFVGAGLNSAIDQAQNSDPSFGQGMAGYGKRYGAALADSASSDFFHTFLFPSLFRQDPRYYRRLEGNRGERLGHALSHTFIARGDSGRNMFNFSEWLGTASSTALANTYHPGNARGIAPAASRMGISLGTDMGLDVMREFWPEIVRKLKLPFRLRERPPGS